MNTLGIVTDCYDRFLIEKYTFVERYELHSGLLDVYMLSRDPYRAGEVESAFRDRRTVLGAYLRLIFAEYQRACLREVVSGQQLSLSNEDMFDVADDTYMLGHLARDLAWVIKERFTARELEQFDRRNLESFFGTS